MRTLEAPKWIEQFDLSNASKLFVPLSLMLPLDKSVEPLFFMATCVVPAWEERKSEEMLEVFGLSMPRDCPYRKRIPFWET